jgi:hypothetical protein
MDSADGPAHWGRGRASSDLPGAPLYRIESNQSNASIFEDVGMAHDEVFFLMQSPSIEERLG